MTLTAANTTADSGDTIIQSHSGLGGTEDKVGVDYRLNCKVCIP